jgi:hypothetical protein
MSKRICLLSSRVVIASIYVCALSAMLRPTMAGAEEDTCRDRPPPTPLAEPSVKKCNDDYVCTGDVTGCTCPEDGWQTIRSECMKSIQAPYKRQGKCICLRSPTPVAEKILGMGASEEFVFGSGITHQHNYENSINTYPHQHLYPHAAVSSGSVLLVECPVCNTNYQAQLSPADPQGCRMPPSHEKLWWGDASAGGGVRMQDTGSASSASSAPLPQTSSAAPPPPPLCPAHTDTSCASVVLQAHIFICRYRHTYVHTYIRMYTCT